MKLLKFFVLALSLLVCAFCNSSFGANAGGGVSLPPVTVFDPLYPSEGHPKQYVTLYPSMNISNSGILELLNNPNKFKEIYDIETSLETEISANTARIQLLAQYMENTFVKDLSVDVSSDGNVEISWTTGTVSGKSGRSSSKTFKTGGAFTGFSSANGAVTLSNNKDGTYGTLQTIQADASYIQILPSQSSSSSLTKLRHSPNITNDGTEDLNLPSAHVVVGTGATAAGITAKRITSYRITGEKNQDVDVFRNLTQISDFSATDGKDYSTIKLTYRDASGGNVTKQVSVKAGGGGGGGGGYPPDGKSITFSPETEGGTNTLCLTQFYESDSLASRENPCFANVFGGQILDWAMMDEMVDSQSLEKVNGEAQFGIKGWSDASSTETLLGKMFQSEDTTDMIFGRTEGKDTAYYVFGKFSDYIDTTSALSVDSNLLTLKLDEQGGIYASENGLAVYVDESSGIGVDDYGIHAKLKDDGGLSVNDDGISVNVSPSGGLTTGNLGLKIDTSGASGSTPYMKANGDSVVWGNPTEVEVVTGASLSFSEGTFTLTLNKAKVKCFSYESTSDSTVTLSGQTTTLLTDVEYNQFNHQMIQKRQSVYTLGTTGTESSSDVFTAVPHPND